MIIIMKPKAREEDINYVIARARSLGFNTHVSHDEERTLISLLGDIRGVSTDAVKGLRGVERVVPLDLPFRLASREFKQEPTLIPLNGFTVGGDQIIIMAGPCAVESRGQLLDTAEVVKQAGGKMLRGGAFKPRTSPYSFQGLGETGLELLAEARKKTGLLIITEVMASEQVSLVSKYADVLQIGTRNMLNYALLHAVGESGKPVLLKRGMMSTIREFLMSAEYILSHGNNYLMLCERGIRTFETATRNTLDINAIPLLKELTHLPVIVDPSHATGKASLVMAVSKAAIAAGADGLLIEVHCDPENALSDGYQSLDQAGFNELMTELDKISLAVGRFI